MLAAGSRYHVTPSTLLPLDPMDLALVERASQRRMAPEEILIATVRIVVFLMIIMKLLAE